MANYIAEPFKIKAMEPLRVTTPEYRRERIEAAGYNPFSLRAEDVYIDLQTDSGTGALSDRQWASLLIGDESYSGGRSYYKLLDTARALFGEDYYIQPVHQGRAAEKVLFPALIEPGQHVVSNTLFDTTRGHVGLAGGVPVDLVTEAGRHPAVPADFKGDIDIPALKEFIAAKGADSIAAVMITITNNSLGGQPVAIANMREARRVADRHGLPLLLDAARFAENAYFVKRREPEFADASISEIVQETFALADAFTISAKKDGLVNIGGLLGVRDHPALTAAVKSSVVAMEGFLTYGGLAGRDLEALAVGLTEAVDEDLLRYRIGQVQYLGARLEEAGIVHQTPVGGHGVFVDAAAFLPHLAWHEFPGHALAIELYVEAGIRAADIGSLLLDPDPVTGEAQRAVAEFTRLAIPRRVYTQAHLDVVADALIAIKDRAADVPGYEIVEQAKVLRHFTARLRPITR
ncbi:tryptophanase [Glycomyces arizonensis]|uniref:tryptophanase n=1 Tax=Glycomyces arizonensis TaxID=256035 RepID=UPI0004129F5B|nr:tryptophanase [Glycomyces arizonensis]